MLALGSEERLGAAVRAAPPLLAAILAPTPRVHSNCQPCRPWCLQAACRHKPTLRPLCLPVWLLVHLPPLRDQVLPLLQPVGGREAADKLRAVLGVFGSASPMRECIGRPTQAVGGPPLGSMPTAQS